MYMATAAKKYDVFISYSRADESRIAPVVKLVRSLRDDLVFQDVQDILPGERWEDALLTALHGSSVVIVFWCEHAAASTYVEKEWAVAVEEGKKIIPLLLDNTKLPGPLSQYQWIDLRSFGIHQTKVPLPPSYDGNITNFVSKETLIASLIRKRLDEMVPQ